MSDEFSMRLSADGGVVMAGVPDWMLGALREVPELLDPGIPEKVRSRLYPAPSDDAEQQGEWRRMVEPELFALVASARDIMENDLDGCSGPDAEGAYQVTIPAEHVNGWISALNTARLHLGALHDVTAQDLDSEEHPGFDERGRDIQRIQFFGLLQQILVDGVIQRLNPGADPPG